MGSRRPNSRAKTLQFYGRVEYITSSVPLSGTFGPRGTVATGLAAVALCADGVEFPLPSSGSAELC